MNESLTNVIVLYCMLMCVLCSLHTYGPWSSSSCLFHLWPRRWCVFYPQVKLVQHAYSCLFGTFTCNTPQQQAAGQVQEHTLSVWSLFICHTSKYLNLLYTPGADQVQCSQVINLGWGLGVRGKDHTLSVWSLFTCYTSKYLNLLYTPGADQV